MGAVAVMACFGAEAIMICVGAAAVCILVAVVVAVVVTVVCGVLHQLRRGTDTARGRHWHRGLHITG